MAAAMQPVVASLGAAAALLSPRMNAESDGVHNLVARRGGRQVGGPDQQHVAGAAAHVTAAARHRFMGMHQNPPCTS